MKNMSLRLSIIRSIMQGSGLGPLLFLLYILDRRPLSSINIMWKYGSMSAICHSNVHSIDMLPWRNSKHVFRNRLMWTRSVLILKLKEIVCKRLSLRNYNPSPIVQIEQVNRAKLFCVFLTPTYSLFTHVNYITAIMSLRLYLLNQLRKQGLDIKCPTELFVRLIIARFQYALPAFAGQLTISDINRIDAIFAKWFK